MSLSLFRNISNICLLLLCLLGLLAGCTANRQIPYIGPGLQELWFSQYPESADHYLQQAATAQPPQRYSHQLYAVGRLLQDGKKDRAQQLLQILAKKPLRTELRQRQNVLLARLQLMNKQPKSALQTLRAIEYPASLPRLERISYHELLAQSYQQQYLVAESIKQRILMDSFISGNLKNGNREQLWSDLQQLSLITLRDWQEQTVETDAVLRSWLQLAIITKDSNNNRSQLAVMLKSWQQQNPEHGANAFLPSNISENLRSTEQSAKKVSLLLPLTGSLAEPGRAIRDGFMAAFYSAPAWQQRLLQVEVRDSSKGDIKQLYQQEVDNGSNFVIGPLSKAKVGRLAEQGNLPVPTLALNYSGNAAGAGANLYQFGLSPQHEAEQVAAKAAEAGLRRALLVAPQGAWGQTVSNAFTQRWQQLQGRVVDQLRYTDKTDLDKAMKQLLKIDSSYQRKKEISQIVASKVSFKPQRRQDIDVVILLAPVHVARQVGPLLKFYYAENLPIYASSAVYSAKADRQRDSDLNGIIFCDIPWVFAEGAGVQQQYERKHRPWSKELNSYTRLYALGKDAFSLVDQLDQLPLFSRVGMQGVSGRLSIDSQQRIVRSLAWAQFKKGAAQRLRG